MKKVLVVDDSKTILAILKVEIDSRQNIDAYYASDYKSALHLIREHQGHFHAALLDLNLPDAPDGEIVKLASANNIPTVVLSGSLNDKLRSSLMKKDVLDFILKEIPSSVKFAVDSITRTLRNYDTYILIVDDSNTYRKVLKKSLDRIKVNTLEAANGEEALQILEKNPNITLIITDYEMPKMNGLDLILKIRENFKKDQIAIIAMSSIKEQETITKFLRFGANDFLTKPFTHNEVVTRINSNLEILDLFTTIKDMANKDFLTGMYNRRYFFDSGIPIFKKNKRNNQALAVAMLDIDKFKNINDTYGHDVGDDAIKEIKKILDKNLRESDLVSRFGGEEFCIILEDIKLKDLKILFERVRAAFESNIIHTHGIKISYTVSIGISFGILDSLEEMIKTSDKALYKAKTTGRNRVVIKV